MEVGRRALEVFADVEVFESDRMIDRPSLLSGVAGADHLWTLGDTPIDAEVMDAGPRLKGIATMALFPHAVDVEAATARGLPVTVVPQLVTKTTCDLTMALILALAWRLLEADRFTREGRFHQEQSTSFLVPGLTGKTVGMIGLGEIGAEIAKRLRAFETRVIYTKRTRLDPDREAFLGVEWEPDRDRLLREADVVVIMATYNADTHAMIGARELGLMRRTAMFVNTARGRIVDEAALVAALRTGEIAGAGLDVYWNEPPRSEPSPSRELFELPNVILTPHIGTAARDTREAMSLAVVENLRAMVEGRRPPGVFNPEVYGEAALARSDRLA
jgi:glyoxylate reductase